MIIYHHRKTHPGSPSLEIGMPGFDALFRYLLDPATVAWQRRVNHRYMGWGHVEMEWGHVRVTEVAAWGDIVHGRGNHGQHILLRTSSRRAYHPHEWTPASLDAPEKVAAMLAYVRGVPSLKAARTYVTRAREGGPVPGPVTLSVSQPTSWGICAEINWRLTPGSTFTIV